MYQPDITPLGGLTSSALVALIPLVVVFVTLGVLRWRAHWAGIAALVAAVVVAVLVYDMPTDLALLSATQGAVFGLFPIAWIVFAAVALYQVTVVSGRFDDLRATFNLVSDDPRIQAMVIAFCFGALLEALAGFGAPVAITGVMVMAVGFSALRAAAIVLVANTAPVAFGAIAIPIITAGELTGIDYKDIGAYVGHMTPLLAFIVPLVLVLIADGWRGVRETWPAALVTGVTFGVAQWVSATYISVELTDIIASLVALVASVGFLRVWRPRGVAEARERLLHAREEELASMSEEQRGQLPDVSEKEVTGLNGGRIFMALVPYLIVILVFSVTRLITPITDALAEAPFYYEIGWPGLDGNVLSSSGEVSTSTIFKFDWLNTPGTLLILCLVLTALVYRVSPGKTFGAIGTTANQLKWTTLTIASVLALAFVMNFSGQTITIGTWIAGAGAVGAFLSPILGWLGTAVTGSDTSSNALFATLQQTAAEQSGVDPTLLVAANTAGGVVGKMISPQNLAIAATAVGLIGREADILRKVLGWSIGFLVVLCLLVGLMSTPALSWILP